MADPFTLAVIALTVLALLGLPIGHAMICGTVLYLLARGQDMGTAAEQLLNGLYGSYVLLAVPLFILAAELMNIGSITGRLLSFCNALVGRFRGGLAQVNILQSVIFAGMSGSAIADAAGTGKVMQAMMTQGGRYTPSYAAALTAASAVIGPIIPPSIPMIYYALVSDASIGYLFLGGVIPGLMMGVALMTIVAVTARRRNFPVEAPVPLRDFPAITGRAFPALLPKGLDGEGCEVSRTTRDFWHNTWTGRSFMVVGAPGTVEGVNAADALDATLSPTELVATTVAV